LIDEQRRRSPDPDLEFRAYGLEVGDPFGLGKVDED
jgi:hypothetical protein